MQRLQLTATICHHLIRRVSVSPRGGTRREVGRQARAPAECLDVSSQRLARGDPATLDLADPADRRRLPDQLGLAELRCHPGAPQYQSGTLPRNLGHDRSNPKHRASPHPVRLPGTQEATAALAHSADLGLLREAIGSAGMIRSGNDTGPAYLTGR
jgi:hypothetical protein